MVRSRDEALKDQKLSKDEDSMEGKGLESEKSILDEGSLDDEDMNPLEKNLTLEAELVKAKAKAEDHYGQLQRLQADFDNYRKRTQKEKQNSLNMRLNALWESCFLYWTILIARLVRPKSIRILHLFRKGWR
jgi:molecular chaperone GrpE (heat shock protein)